MKLTLKNIITSVIAGLILFAAVPLNANAVTQNVLSYTVTNGQATIVYCDKAAVGELTIPDTLGGFPVTSIDDSAFGSGLGGGAFAWCTGLTSISIPDSVTSIKNRFRPCDALESISVDAGNKAYTSESGVLFNKSKTELIQYPASKKGSSYTVPNSVKSIGDRAFYECKGLTSITIPDSVTSIGDSAFYECLNLKNINISNSVTTIGEGAFGSTAWYDKQHDGLIYAGLVACGYKGEMRKNTDVVLKPGTKGIAGKAFYNCVGLKNITIPNSVVSIGEQAFYGCDKLTSIAIPASVTSIGDGAFHMCDALKGFNIDAGNPTYTSENDVLFNKSKTKLIQYPRGKNNISYTIPNSVKCIGDNAFSSCSDLTSVTIPNSVTSIGKEAFEYCSAIKNIIIPKSVSSIGEKAFYECSNLTSVTIPNSVMSIGDSAFKYCSALKSVTIPNSVTSIGDSAFYRCTGLTSITIPDGVKSIGNEVFTGCEGLTSINVSKANKVYASENGVLFNHSKKEIICYPKGKTGAYTIPKGVKSIGESAFKSCKYLKSVKIPNSVTDIGDFAFSGCLGLSNISIPNSVTSIGVEAFYGTAWYDDQPNGLIYAGTVAYFYKGFIPDNTAIDLKSGTKGIADGAFQPVYDADNPGLISVSIPNSVTNIGEFAFSGCTGLKSITIPNSVTNIGEQAFGYYISLDYAVKNSGLTISCFANSEGLRYAKENGFAYDILPASADMTDPTATTMNAATTIDGSTRTTSASTTVNDSTSAVAATTTSNGSTSTPATTTNSSSGTSNRVTVWAVILTMVAFLTVAAIAVLIIAKKKK